MTRTQTAGPVNWASTPANRVVPLPVGGGRREVTGLGVHCRQWRPQQRLDRFTEGRCDVDQRSERPGRAQRVTTGPQQTVATVP